MKIAIYVRKSVYTDIGESIENQILMCKKYIENKFIGIEYEIIIFSDKGVSAKNTERPEFQKMLYFIQNKLINSVVVYRLDRLSRNICDFSNLIEMFDKNGVDFISIKEEFDTSKPMGKAMLYMATIFAQLERETIAERVKDNMYLLAKKGYWLGGNFPTGYKSIKCKKNFKIRHNLILDEDEAQKVKLIYNLMLEKKSVSKVLNFLQKNNIKTKDGKDFSNNTIREILLNPVYCMCEKEIFEYFKENLIDIPFEFKEEEKEKGLLVYGKRKYLKGKVLKNEKKDWIISRGEHKGIISAKDWIFVQQFFKSKKIHKPHNEIALFSGKIICSKCENKMIFKANSKIKENGIFYYICKTKIEKGTCQCCCKNINGKNLDTKVWKLIEKRFNIEKEKNNTQIKQNKIKKCKKDIEKTINLIMQIENKTIIKELEKKVVFLEENLKKIEKEKAFNFELNIFEKRNLIEKYIEKIIWNGKDIEIAFK